MVICFGGAYETKKNGGEIGDLIGVMVAGALIILIPLTCVWQSNTQRVFINDHYATNYSFMEFYYNEELIMQKIRKLDNLSETRIAIDHTESE
jgi:hypothetical protein